MPKPLLSYYHPTYHFAGPNVPLEGNAFHGVPIPSAVVELTVLPHQFNSPPGNITAKKITMAETATPESRLADRI